MDMAAIQTCAAAGQKIYPLVPPSLEPLCMSPKEFLDLQKVSPTPTSLWIKAVKKELDIIYNGSTLAYQVSNGLLYKVGIPKFTRTCIIRNI